MFGCAFGPLAGSIAVHCIEVDFARRLTDGGLQLPFHRALKRVPYVDDAGDRVEPDEPNAIKFETFLFDALPFADRTVTVEGAREDVFSPIKNAEGSDSPETMMSKSSTVGAQAAAATVWADMPGGQE